MSSRKPLSIPYNVVEILKEEERRVLEESLIEFIKWSFKKSTGKTFHVNSHHIRICEALERVYRHETNRLIINMPPRYGKTQVAVKGFIEWCMAKAPWSKFIHLSYSDNLVLDNSSSIREDVKSDWFQHHWPVKVKRDSDAREKWYLEDGGGLYATSTGGPITGFGAGATDDGWAGAVIIDDPIKPTDSFSEGVRDKINDRLNNTIMSRLNNPKKTPIVIIMQRTHEMDMTGFCIGGGTGEKWEHLSIPVLDENDTPLWPLKHDFMQLMVMKAADNRTFSAQYQQRPAPSEGAIFHHNWFKFYKTLPSKMSEVVQAWDFAIKDKTTSDFTCGIVMGRVGADKYLLDMFHAKVNFPAACQAVINLSMKWPQAYKKIIEDKANGPAVVDSLKKQVPGLVLVTPGSDKVARANAVAPDVEAGNVYLPDPSIAPWIHDFIYELTTFPVSKNDDMVDSFCYALSELRRSGLSLMPTAGHGSGRIY